MSQVVMRGPGYLMDDYDDGTDAVRAFDKIYQEDDDDRQARLDARRREQMTKARPPLVREFSYEEREKQRLQEELRRIKELLQAQERERYRPRAGALRSCVKCGSNTNSQLYVERPIPELGQPICGPCFRLFKDVAGAMLVPTGELFAAAPPVQPAAPKPFVEPIKGRARVVAGEECP